MLSKRRKSTDLILIALFVFLGCSSNVSKAKRELGALKVPVETMDRETILAYHNVHEYLEEQKKARNIHSRTKIDCVQVNQAKRTIDIYFTSPFVMRPIREAGPEENGFHTPPAKASKKTTFINYRFPRHQPAIYVDSNGSLPFLGLENEFEDYKTNIWVTGRKLQEYIPNFFRSSVADYDSSRMPIHQQSIQPIVQNISKPWRPASGLFSRHIALWPSHGWYYDYGKQRWDWQRARVYQTVEDLLPLAFIQPYLVPMLENAGANVFLPRERDIQTHEVIIDETEAMKSGDWQTEASGFALPDTTLEAGDNPFRSGKSLFTSSDTTNSQSIKYVPEIPETGRYAVSIAYRSDDSRATDVEYVVNHAGGQTSFKVNQQIGGSTWIYLGTFKFLAGTYPDSGSVLITNKSALSNATISADAVRFGGGMGSVARNGQTSGRPRYMEGARYYMQYAGMPDTLVYNVTENPKGDYKDDYRGRGEWVNYLAGAPFGPNKDRNTKGLGIPIDASVAFHTDAGTTRNGSVIGTLMIYSETGADTTTAFPDSMSRMANRDMADIMQSQIVSDLEYLFNPYWKRRSLWNSRYSEAFRPNVPSVLLELLSHHNYEDMKYALDPRFRFYASRAIYKGLLRFITTQHRQAYVVQPLPVSHFNARFINTGLQLSWRPVEDALEPTANPTAYILYTRIESGGWDNGVLLEQPQIVLSELVPNTIYSFKITAVNDGGESFPSEILSACKVDTSKSTVLIVNGFDRIGGPAILEEGNLLGFADFIDEGVPHNYDLNYSGSQFNFKTDSKWTNNDSPGNGASFADMETTVIPGNTFDFPYVHGKTIRSAGFSFVSSSDEAVESGSVEMSDYSIVNFILGEEKRLFLEYGKGLSFQRYQNFVDKSPQFSQAYYDSLEQIEIDMLLERADNGATQLDMSKFIPEGLINYTPIDFELFSSAMQKKIRSYLNSGGALFASGAHIGSELFENKGKSHRDAKFGREVLKINGRTNHASRRGEVVSTSDLFPQNFQLRFNTDFHPSIYKVEAPDGLEPADSTAMTVLRYKENNLGAAVAHSGSYRVFISGFPFETILSDAQRNDFMRFVLRFLSR